MPSSKRGRAAPGPWVATSGSEGTETPESSTLGPESNSWSTRGTFREIGTLVGGDVPADGIVAGTGLIDDRPVMVGAEDFTTLAGTIGPGSNAKRYRLAELALRPGLPL